MVTKPSKPTTGSSRERLQLLPVKTAIAAYPRLAEWRIAQLAQSLSRRTVDERICAIHRMAEWCDTDPETATVADLAEWLAEGGEWSTNTRWTYYTHLNAWYSWLVRRDYRIDNPVDKLDHPRRAKGVPHPVSDADLCRILAIQLRKPIRAMIILAAFQGFRTHEIAKVKGEDFNLVERTVTVTGKGGLTVVLPLHPETAFFARTMPTTGFWFPGADRGHQRRESVGNAIKAAMVRAGVVGSAHSLRHWFGTALVEADVDLRTTQTLLRHQNLATTEIYTKVSDSRRTDGIGRLDPWRRENQPDAA